MATYITKQRKFLLNFLYEHPHETFSAFEIAENLKCEKISLSAVYRNLSELELENKVRRHYKSGSKEIYYQYVSDDFCKNSLHLSCTKCEKIFHMDLKSEQNLTAQIQTVDEFEIDKIKTILYGLCNNCKHTNI